MRHEHSGRFCEIVEEEITRSTGWLARVSVKSEVKDDIKFEMVSIKCISDDGKEFWKKIPLSEETVYQNPWCDIAKRISEHLEINKVNA